ncbi:MAG: nucleotidyl transferase AbiEii/AbiGii toxin family protein [Mycobacteriales bacterium]
MSHLLAVLAREFAQEVIFFGGTALARTHLPHGRLSGDVDLIATGRNKRRTKRVASRTKSADAIGFHGLEDRHLV